MRTVISSTLVLLLWAQSAVCWYVGTKISLRSKPILWHKQSCFPNQRRPSVSARQASYGGLWDVLRERVYLPQNNTSRLGSVTTSALNPERRPEPDSSQEYEKDEDGYIEYSASLWDKVVSLVRRSAVVAVPIAACVEMASSHIRPKTTNVQEPSENQVGEQIGTTQMRWKDRLAAAAQNTAAFLRLNTINVNAVTAPLTTQTNTTTASKAAVNGTLTHNGTLTNNNTISTSEGITVGDNRTNAQVTRDSFITLIAALAELATEAGGVVSTAVKSRRNGRNSTQVRIVDRSENQFSRVRLPTNSTTSTGTTGHTNTTIIRTANHTTAADSAQPSTTTLHISSLGAFVGRMYRQGRLLFGKTDRPGEDLSEAVLAYLAAADSLGLDLKDVAARAAEEDQCAYVGAKSIWSMIPHLWRKTAPASSPLGDTTAGVQPLKPSRSDFAFVHARRTEMALAAALAVHSETAARSFAKHVGIHPVLSALHQEGLNVGKAKVKIPNHKASELRADAVTALSNLIRFDKPLAAAIASMPDVVSVLCDLLEAPTQGFRFWQSKKDTERLHQHQCRAIELVLRIVRSSDQAVDILRQNERLRKALHTIAEFDTKFSETVSSEWASNAVKELSTAMKPDSTAKTSKSHTRKQSNTTVVGELDGLDAPHMARIAAWGLGGVPWRPRAPGQKGLRILSFDGGGTRGVLSIAFLREIMQRVNNRLEPHEMFDIICGTSTGGIIATLLGAQRTSLGDAEVLYDAFIDKIFGTRSNMRLVTSQAAYDERDWEKILHEMCGDSLMLDSNQHDCPRVFCVSSKANSNPPTPNLWRNYNYPPGQVPRYPGACRVNTFTAIRSTTAAPTFFTPVHWNGGLYYDGALVANNPTAIALQEAKLLYPNVPVELVVSIGTGLTTTHSAMRSMGWDVLVNQLIASSTDTEDVHALLHNFLSPDKYFRFNPVLPDALRIDEKNKTILGSLKNLARRHVEEVEGGPEGKSFQQLIKTLRGGK